MRWIIVHGKRINLAYATRYQIQIRTQLVIEFHEKDGYGCTKTETIDCRSEAMAEQILQQIDAVMGVSPENTLTLT